MNLDAATVRDLLNYDEKTGIFTWKRRRKGKRIGDVAGYKHSTQGRFYVGLLNSRYLAHRLAWLHWYGEWPNGEIDHIDRNAGNNAIANLRIVDRHTNMQNQLKVRSDSTVGLKGAVRHGNGFVARIRAYGKFHYLGYYRTAEEAHAAYLRGKQRFHGGFVWTDEQTRSAIKKAALAIKEAA